MPYYDRIARKWHSVTGSQGGALKRLLLNDLMLSRLSGIADLAILELGAGNGYFMPLLLRRFSGQVPSRIVITDHSHVLLKLAQRNIRVACSEYRVLDVRHSFPFPDQSFDLILANMVFNEITTPALRRALRECQRMLSAGGRLLATTIHPAFVKSLDRRGQLKPFHDTILTMPGAEGLRLPVVQRSVEEFWFSLEQAGFRCHAEDVYPTAQIKCAKPGLKQAGNGPIALLLDCQKIIESTLAS